MELYFKTREEWRKWLDENHNIVQGVWRDRWSQSPAPYYPDVTIISVELTL